MLSGRRGSRWPTPATLLRMDAFGGRERLMAAILAGLVTGKPLGVMPVSAPAASLKLAFKPSEYSWAPRLSGLPGGRRLREGRQTERLAQLVPAGLVIVRAQETVEVDRGVLGFLPLAEMRRGGQ